MNFRAVCRLQSLKFLQLVSLNSDLLFCLGQLHLHSPQFSPEFFLLYDHLGAVTAIPGHLSLQGLLQPGDLLVFGSFDALNHVFTQLVLDALICLQLHDLLFKLVNVILLK